MQLTNAGYKDPNNLKFENITIMGLPFPPTSTEVLSSNRDGGFTSISNYNEYYDSDKKVQKPFPPKNATHFFFCRRTDSKVK